MKKKLSLIFLFLATGVLAGDTYVLNEVLVTIPGKTRTGLILTGDVRPSLDGRPRMLRDVTIEELMIFDAELLNITVTEDDIDKYIKQLQKTYSKKQIDDTLQAMGLTMADAREQLRRQEMTNRLVDYRIRGDKRLMIQRADVEDDWARNAPQEDATVTLSEAIIKTAETKEQLETRIAKNGLAKDVSWQMPFTLNESDLAQDKKFVMKKNVGDIVFINPIADGFEITKLVSKTSAQRQPLITGNEVEDNKRIAQIEDKLRMERFNTIRDEYEKSLLSKYKPKFTYESDRRAVYGE